MKVLLATRNEGKKHEYADLMSGLGIEWLTLGDLGVDLDVEETGTTFEENALLKARGYAAETGLLTLADDSGLVVDALDGAPGVYSARYGGEAAPDDRARTRLLLRNMESVSDDQRTARFRCVIAIASPDGRAETASGACEGCITRAPVGENGFGYDPVFFVPQRGCTMAQLPAEIKNQISHRAQAAMPARAILARWLAEIV